MHAYLTSFDHALAAAVKLLPAWLSPLMRAASFIGEPVATVSVGVLVAGIALVRNAPRIVWAEAWAMAAFGGNTLLKHWVRRTRPDTLYVHHMRIRSYSFPSGHAFGSMILYGLLAYLAATRLPHPWNVVAALFLGFLILLIGVSRVYLEAHFPSDVVVGWVLAGLSLFIIIKLVRP